ncbi:MAG: glycosyltransferase family 4 protein [Bacteroidota bacterium]
MPSHTDQRPIKILETIRQGQIGGGETHVIDLVSRMDRTQFEPIVLSFTDGPMVELLRKRDIKVYVEHTTKPFNWFMRPKVNQIIERENIQLIHAHGTRATSNTFWSAQKFDIPLMYTVHGWSFHPSLHPLMFWMRHRSEGYLTNKADLTVCVSEANRQEGKSFFPLEKSTIVYYGIDTDRYDPTRPSKDVRGELGISEDQILVGYIARMTTQKDPFTLVKAIQQAAPQDPRLHFLLVGDGELRAETVKMVEESGLDERVTFTGFRQDIPDVLQAIDMYVLPSLWEGLPIGLLESMSMGRAAIASKVDGTVEAISHKENGWLIDSKRPDQLAEAMVTLARHPEMIDKLGHAARQTVVERFSLEAMVRNVEKEYRKLLRLPEPTPVFP